MLSHKHKLLAIFLLAIQISFINSFNFYGGNFLKTPSQAMRRARNDKQHCHKRTTNVLPHIAFKPIHAHPSSQQFMEELNTNTFMESAETKCFDSAAFVKQLEKDIKGEARWAQLAMSLFYKEYSKEISPRYRYILAKTLVSNFIELRKNRVVYDPFIALGLHTQFHAIMKDYPLTLEMERIFDAYVKVLGFDPIQVNKDVQHLQGLLKECKIQAKPFLPAIHCSDSVSARITACFTPLRNKQQQQQHQEGQGQGVALWGIGVGTCLEAAGGCDKLVAQCNTIAQHVLSHHHNNNNAVERIVGDVLHAWYSFRSQSAGSPAVPSHPNHHMHDYHHYQRDKMRDYQALQKSWEEKKHTLMAFNTAIASSYATI